MSETKPLSYIVSSITLNSLQQEEFIRIAALYNRVYNHLLLQWCGYAVNKPLPHIGSGDLRYIDERLRNLLHLAKWIDSEEKQIACFAANELCRVLKERNELGLMELDPKNNNLDKTNDEVIFYRDYDIRVKEKTVRLPVLGKAKIGRFSYFSGSIRGIGVRTDANGDLQCLIYYKENDGLFKAKDASVWQVDGTSVPISHLNARLRRAGIGFMT